MTAAADLTRRSLLRRAALGAGATVLTPMLGQLAAHASGDASAAVRRRVVFVLQSNGMNPAHLVPVGVKRRPDGRNERPTNETTEELSLKDKTLHAALEPLSPFKDRLTLIQGLSGRIAVSDHSANHGALGACPANKGPMSQTIDSALSEALPAGPFRHVAIGYGGSEEAMNYAYSASGPGKAVPSITSPDLAYKALFGSVAEGEGRAAFNRRSNLLDFMADDVRRSRSALAGEEQQKLDRYVEAFENLRDRQRELVAKEDELKRYAPKLGEKQTTSMASLTVEAQFETAAAALIAGLTNCVTLTSGGGGSASGSSPSSASPTCTASATATPSAAPAARSASSSCASSTRSRSRRWPPSSRPSQRATARCSTTR